MRLGGGHPAVLFDIKFICNGGFHYFSICKGCDDMAKILREYRMLFERVAGGDTSSSGKLGLRSKLGGTPDCDQSDETPKTVNAK